MTLHRILAFALVLPLTSCGPKPFPEGFLFGAAVAGFQVDPGCPTLPSEQCEDQNSDWYQWVNGSAELQDLKEQMTFEPLANGPGHWELYDSDFARAEKDMGFNGLRMSLEWSRIFPTPTDGLEGDALAAAANQEAIAHYHAMFASLKAHHMKPLVTLHHYTLPLWIHDGIACHKDLSACTKRGWLEHDRIIREIAKYAGFVAKEFGGEVDLWATQNEPFAVVLPGFLLPSEDRVNPPGVTLRFAEAKAVMIAMIEAHARMYDAVKANDTFDADADGSAATVGLVYSMTPTKGKTDSRLDQRAAENIFYLYNTAFLDGVAKGIVDVDLDGVPDSAEPREDLKGRMDYLGINYYTRLRCTGVGSPSFPTLSPLTTFDPTNLELWEDYPQGLYEMQLHVKNRYELPSFVTETGVADPGDDSVGESWLVRYLGETKRAIKDGADVRGFFYWSLLDNYEWNHGMGMRFGLYAVGSEQTKPRTARKAVGAYAKIVKARDVPEDLAKQFPVGP